MGYDEIIKQAGCLHTDSGAAMIEINSAERLPLLMFQDVHIKVFIMRGKLDVELNGTRYLMDAFSFADIVSEGSMRIISASDDIIAYLIICTNAFMHSMLRNDVPFPMQYIMNVKKNPITSVPADRCEMLQSTLMLTVKTFQDSENNFYEQMVRSCVDMLIMGMADAFIHNMRTEISDDLSARQKELFHKFFELLRQNISHEHGVAYYADRLCVTPQYLTRVVKAMTGHSAQHGMSQILLGEIINALRNTDKSLQQIAHDCGFTDQPTFIKFFKRYMGVTPKEYRGNSRQN